MKTRKTNSKIYVIVYMYQKCVLKKIVLGDMALASLTGLIYLDYELFIVRFYFIFVLFTM